MTKSTSANHSAKKVRGTSARATNVRSKAEGTLKRVRRALTKATEAKALAKASAPMEYQGEFLHVVGMSSVRTPILTQEQREAIVREKAYFRALARGFAPGGDVEDWLAAEEEMRREELMLA